ncbi:MAG: glycerol-3-phosphate 1-O-acyltransferase PlsY [Elusimicrobiota bacterium]
MPDIFLVIFSYLLGSLPSGYLVALAAGGLDIRERGSGNPGAANVFHVLGAGPGLTTLIADILKGYLPVYLAQHCAGSDARLVLLCGAAAICGHTWMLFLRFNGGKAVATTAGVFLALSPTAMLPTITIFAVTVWISGHISIGSISSSALFPLITIVMRTPPHTTGLAFLSCILILIRHISNVEHLRKYCEEDYDTGSELEKIREIQ